MRTRFIHFDVKSAFRRCMNTTSCLRPVKHDSSSIVALEDATIPQHCKALRMPMIASQFNQLAEQPVRENRTHIEHLEALLAAEIEEREKNTIERRLKEARLPRVKTLEEFDFNQAPLLRAAKMRDLPEGGCIDRAEPVLLIGDCGTGQTHLLTGSALPHAARSAGFVLPLPQHWSTNWPKRNTSCNYGA
jgi:crotonobetainyl-CoA:carnitine CoA-transferase CaiB-like acyl-CoA transferase